MIGFAVVAVCLTVMSVFSAFAVIELQSRIEDLQLDIARQKSRIAKLEWDK